MSDAIGVFELGNMGGEMAASLARVGFTVLGFDTVQATRDRAEAAGVGVVGDIAPLVGQVDAILSMPPDWLDVEACLLGGGGVLEHVGPGTVIMAACTIATATTRWARAAFVAKGWAFIDAPNGTLMFMVGASA